MAAIYEKTLTVQGVKGNVDRFADSLKNAKYLLEDEIKVLDFLKITKTDDSVSIYIYFDDGVAGTISNITILDNDDIEIIKINDSFTKENHNGFYILFKYRFVEEVE